MGRAGWISIFLVGALPLFAQNTEAINALDSDHAYKLAADWIAGSDARHRAWAAELIARNHLEPLYPRLLTALIELQPLTSDKFSGTEEELALEAIVDAIIQCNVPVLADDARKLYPAFPALSMILLSRTTDDNRAALLSILEETKVGEIWLAAANLLAKNPSSEFVSRLLDDFSVLVRIMILDPGFGGGMFDGSRYHRGGDTSKFKIPDDWPIFSVYSLQIGKPGGTIFASGDNPVSLISHPVTGEVDSPWTNAIYVNLDSERFRLGLVRQLTGSSTPTLHERVDRRIVVESERQYQADVLKILEEQAALFRKVVAQLQSKGLLTSTEASERHLHVSLYVIPMGSVKVAPQLPDFGSLGIVLKGNLR